MSGLLTEQQKSVIMITHSLDEAVFWADRILIMSPRPARIVLEIEVKQPRPRQLSFMATPEFAEIRIQLFKVLVALTDGDAESTGAIDTVETESENS
jgi:NitT/TauT family transport system ATP-binding protein